MAIIPFPRRNTLAYPAGPAPGIDPSHPAAQRNALSVVNLAGSFVNLSGGVGQQAGVIQGTPTQGIQGDLGPVMNFQGVSDQVRFFGLPTITQTAITAAAICKFTSVAGIQNQFLVSTDSGSLAGLLIGVNNGSVNFGINYGNGGTGYNTAIPVVVGAPYFYAVSVVSNTSANCVVRRLDTGQIFFETLVMSGAAGSSDGNWAISGRQGATGRQAIAYIAAGMASYAALSQAQLLQWAKDPWAFWYPNRSVNRVAAAAASGFIPAWAMNSNLPVLGTGTY